MARASIPLVIGPAEGLKAMHVEHGSLRWPRKPAHAFDRAWAIRICAKLGGSGETAFTNPPCNGC